MEMETTTLPSLGVTELLRESRNSLETRYLDELSRIREQFNDRAYDPDHPLTPARFGEVSSEIEELSQARRTALVEYFCTDRRLLVFIVLPPKSAAMSQPILLDTGISVEELQDIVQHWDEGQSRLRSGQIKRTHWANGYLEQTLDNLKPAIECPRKAIEQWERESRDSIQRVVIVPHRFLHRLPLHAVMLQDGMRWSETVSIQYVPSASVLCRLHNTVQQDTTGASEHFSHSCAVSKALVVAHSGGKDLLPFNRAEACMVAELTGATLIEDAEATPSRVIDCMREAKYVHFTCHGMHDPDTLLESGLELATPHDSSWSDANATTDKSQPANAHRLTLGRIFEQAQLLHAPVVVLSACDTGIPKVEELRDEYIGLPAAFLFAGARAVISTLWQVNDLATLLLMEGVVRELARGAEPGDALSQSQRDLCHLSIDDAHSSVDRVLAREADPVRRQCMMAAADQVFVGADEPYPFANPYWWSGFIVSGVGQIPMQ